MNLNVSLPPIIPNQLHPQTESAQTDNRRAELVPPLRQGEAAGAESGVASRQEEPSASLMNPTPPSPRHTPAALPQRFVDGTNEDGKHREQASGQHEQRQQQGETGGRRYERANTALVVADPAAQTPASPLAAYMDRRNAVIARRYRQAVRPNPPHSVSQDV